MNEEKIHSQIASELKARPVQVKAAVELLDGGATVPFIARYRKEATQGLDGAQLRELQLRLAYLRELRARRAAVLASIEQQGNLSAELRAAVLAAPTKQELEDLYLPYKPRCRTKAWLEATIGVDEEPAAPAAAGAPSLAEGRIAPHLKWSHAGRPGDELIRKCVAWAWKVKLSLSLERELFVRPREAAEAVAIKVFGNNLLDLLLAAPAGQRVVMGLDPGIRTGVKVGVVSDTGKVLATGTVYPHEPRNDREGALAAAAGLQGRTLR